LDRLLPKKKLKKELVGGQEKPGGLLGEEMGEPDRAAIPRGDNTSCMREGKNCAVSPQIRRKKHPGTIVGKKGEGGDGTGGRT